jgi:hypothetical protein
MAAGAVLGLFSLPVAVAAGYTPRDASGLVFSLGALAFGFGLLGWSGSILVGDAVEIRNARLGKTSDWTEAKSRRAMARIGGFGFGVMLGSAIVSALGFGV